MKLRRLGGKAARTFREAWETSPFFPHMEVLSHSGDPLSLAGGRWPSVSRHLSETESGTTWFSLLRQGRELECGAPRTQRND